MVKYKCDHCGEEIEVKNEGKLLSPDFVTVCQGEAFVYCSDACKKANKHLIVTSKEVEQYLKNLEPNSFTPSYVSSLTSY